MVFYGATILICCRKVEGVVLKISTSIIFYYYNPLFRSQSVNSNPSVERILPSFFKRKGFSKQSVAKRPKVGTWLTWDRDVLCIPKNDMTDSSSLSYPRGKYRAKLATNGIIGKLHISSDMTDDGVATEIRSIFKGPMNNDPNFPFLYLQPTGCGAKSLIIPSQSSTFKWTLSQVARLSGQAGSIYILAQSELSISKPLKVMMQ